MPAGKAIPMLAEFTLAVGCCRAAFDPAALEELDRLAQGIDWTIFERTVERHRIDGLAWNAIVAAQLHPPAAIADILAARARQVSTDGLQRARSCAELLASFRSAKIDLLFLKGLTLGMLAYENAFLKASWDVDLLVLEQCVDEAAVLLQGLGYRRVEPYGKIGLADWHRARKDSTWSRGDTVLELHSRLTDNPALLPQVGMTSPRQNVAVAPAVALQTLGDDALLAYLAVHGASSAWFRLSWLSDFAGLLNNRTANELRQVIECADQIGSARATAQALLLADSIFGLALSPSLRTELRQDRMNRWLAEAARRQLLATSEPTERPFGTAMLHLTQFGLRRGLRFKWQELRTQFAAASANRLNRSHGGGSA